MRYGKLYFYDRLGNRVVPPNQHTTDQAKYHFNGGHSHYITPASEIIASDESARIPERLGNEHELAVLPYPEVPRAPTPPMASREIATDDRLEQRSIVSELPPNLSVVIDDEDLCDSCKWHDVHSAMVTARSIRDKKYRQEEDEAVKQYVEQRNREEYERQQREAEKAKQLVIEIREINRRMAQERRRKRSTESNPGSYIFSSRPDTAPRNRPRQKDFFNELNKQVEQKRNTEEKDRQEQFTESSRHHLLTQQDLDNESFVHRSRSLRQKEEYKRALDAQVAETRAAEAGDELWWSHRPLAVSAHSTMMARPIEDQTLRVAKQELAIKNLEEFLIKDERDRLVQKAADRERRRQMAEDAQRSLPIVNVRPPERVPLTDMDRRTVEDAWRQAAEERQTQVETLRKEQGGALLDQLRHYKRCRKCQKALNHEHTADHTPMSKSERYWYDVDHNVMRPLEKSDEIFLAPRSNSMSRHLSLQVPVAH